MQNKSDWCYSDTQLQNKLYFWLFTSEWPDAL